MKAEIDNTLQTLGKMQHYKGYRFVVMALEIIIEDEDNLCNITTKVYSRIAKHFKCNECCIERDIRTVIKCICNRNEDKLKSMAKYDISVPPSVSEFLGVVYNYIIRNHYYDSL